VSVLLKQISSKIERSNQECQSEYVMLMGKKWILKEEKSAKTIISYAKNMHIFLVCLAPANVKFAQYARSPLGSLELQKLKEIHRYITSIERSEGTIKIH